MENLSSKQLRKNKLVKICGGRCNLCGYNKVNSALEFHHIFPEQKKYSIGNKNSRHNIEEDLNEIKKCILVCANCHREIHEGLYSPEELCLRKIYDENTIEKIKQESMKIRFCSKCGIEMIGRYSKSGLCRKCSMEMTRKAERPNREDLKNMIRVLPFTEIAKQFGVSDKAIVKWCKVEKLPFRKKDIKIFSDEEWKLV